MPDTFRSHLPALASTAAGTLAAAVGGSYLGLAGTGLGLAAGSIIAGTVAWWGERAIRRARDLARYKAAALRRKGRPLSPAETAHIEAVVARRTAGIHWRTITVLTAVPAAVAAAVVLTAWSAAAGQPVSDVVRQRPAPAATVTRLVTPRAAVTSPASALPPSLPASSSAAASPSAAVTPTATPDPSASSPSPSVTPSSPAPGATTSPAASSSPAAGITG